MFRVHEYDDRDYVPPKPGMPDYSRQEEIHTDKMFADRLMAVLEVLRRHEISVDMAAQMAGLSKEQMVHLLRKLAIPFEQ